MKKQYTSSFKSKLGLELFREEKSLSQLASEHQIDPNMLRHWRDTVVSQMFLLFERKTKEAELMREHEAERDELSAEIGRLRTQLAWLKKNLASSLTRAERAELVEWEESKLAIRRQAELLGISRSSLSSSPVQARPEEIKSKHRINEIYTKYPFYGSRRMRAQLVREGEQISRQPVQRYRPERCIAGVSPGPNLDSSQP